MSSGGLTGINRVFARGATIQFATTFYDVNGNVTQPGAAFVNIVYQVGNNTTANLQIAMTPPSAPSVQWTALWDSRNAGPGAVSWSIHTTSASVPPYAVEDGFFGLTANPANLPTF